MKMYIDNEFKCHATYVDGTTEVENDFFEGKAPGYIEGYRFVPAGETWARSDGVVFQGEMIAPWKPWHELDAIQREYEREQYNDLMARLSEVYEGNA